MSIQVAQHFGPDEPDIAHLAKRMKILSVEHPFTWNLAILALILEYPG